MRDGPVVARKWKLFRQWRLYKYEAVGLRRSEVEWPICRAIYDPNVYGDGMCLTNAAGDAMRGFGVTAWILR